MLKLIKYSLILLWCQHSRLLLMLFILYLIVPLAKSQSQTIISREFDQEMANYGIGSNDSTLLSTKLSLLPAWMYNSFSDQTDTIFIFGISDPGLNDSLAHHQAILRALALAALANLTSFDFLSDFYSQSKDLGSSSKYEEIYRFSASFSGNISNQSILNYTTLPSGEAIVLMAIPIIKTGDSLNKNMLIEAVLYNNETDIVSGNKMSKKVDINIRKITTDQTILIDAISFYQLDGKATGMKCLFPQSQSAYNQYEYYYTTSDSGHKADTAYVHGTTYKQGLWIAYTSQILDLLSVQAKKIGKNSQTLRENTHTSTVEIIREQAHSCLLWRIKYIDIYNQDMKVNMHISEFKTHPE